jgi:pyruvate dehydrogenase E1 component alpha subunit
VDNLKRTELYKKMLRIRVFEQKVSELFAKGELDGFYHLYIGQEAVAVGCCAALNKDDYITSTHRGHGHVIAKGADICKMMAEIYGKKTGYCKGKGGSMHIAYPELGILGANGIVGAGLPIATGAAMSAKLQNNGRVALCFFGDGASNQGTFHEAINIASAFNLPVIFVCENNLYGVGTRQTKVRKVEDIAIRAQAYDIPGVIVDGNDVEEVYNVVSQAVDRARAKKGPTLIECKTYRWHTHFEGEPDTYRPREEVKEWIVKDPIQNYRERLLQSGVIDTKILNDIEKEVIAEINRAVEFAKNSPMPDTITAIEEVYA